MKRHPFTITTDMITIIKSHFFSFLPCSKQQLKGFVACAAKQTYPDGTPPSVNVTLPAQCADKLAALQECQFGEVGYIRMRAADPKTSANILYATATVGGLLRW